MDRLILINKEKIINMHRIAKFEKVNFEQFFNDFINSFEYFDYSNPDKVQFLKTSWENIKIPTRGTINSAGYDFVTPIDFSLNPGESIKIPTGLRCKMDGDWVLTMYPRSSIGFKYQIHLANTTGIIDADYYNATNEGHIMVKLVNYGTKIFAAKEGDRIVQGVFLPYGITIDDDTRGERTGGIGSTGK